MSSLPCRAQTLHLPLCARAEADEGRRNPGEILAPGSRVPGFPSQPISSTIARLSEPRGGAANSGSTGVRENRRERLQGGAAAISPAKPPSPQSSSQRIRRWRELDSNYRSRSCEALLGVANRRRRHERRSHSETAMLAWSGSPWPFPRGGTLSSNPSSSCEARTNLYRLGQVSETHARFIGSKRCDVSVVVVGSTRLMA